MENPNNETELTIKQLFESCILCCEVEEIEINLHAATRRALELFYGAIRDSVKDTPNTFNECLDTITKNSKLLNQACVFIVGAITPIPQFGTLITYKTYLNRSNELKQWLN